MSDCPHASHHPAQLFRLKRRAQNGMAYEADGGIYFDAEGMGSEYGKLGVQASSSAVPEQGGGSDLSRGKRNHKDFALWKKAKPDEPR